MRARDQTSHRTWYLLAGLLLATVSSAIAEDLTLTTYYPSPRGVYNELRTLGQTILAEQGDSKVGIGTATPTRRLDVEGGNLRLNDKPGDPANGLGNIRRPDDSDNAIQVGNGVNRYYGSQRFLNTAGGHLGMVVEEGGFVGIGTPKDQLPNELLHLANPAGTVRILLDTPNRDWALVAYDDPLHPPQFRIKDETAGEPRLAIDQAGNVGIGKTDPAARLDVNGTAKSVSFTVDGDVNGTSVHTPLFCLNGVCRGTWPVCALPPGPPPPPPGPPPPGQPPPPDPDCPRSDPACERECCQDPPTDPGGTGPGPGGPPGGDPDPGGEPPG